MLLCIRDLARRYGHEFERRYSGSSHYGAGQMGHHGGQVEPGGGSSQMYEYIANLFYFGFKKPLIEALKELTRICGGQYRMGIQTKLLNTIYIILTHKVDYFPVVSLINQYKKNQLQRQKEMKKYQAIRERQEAKKELSESPGFNINPLTAQARQ